MAESASPAAPLLRTPLYDWHADNGAKLVGFAGYDMPVQYADGIIAEHKHTRTRASLFDVSHMGQISLWGDEAVRALERLVPADLLELPPWALRYAQLTNDAGGIIDDLMVTNGVGRLMLVVNASRKATDLAHLEARLGHAVDVALLRGRALIALQGPYAAVVLARHAPRAAQLLFMNAVATRIGKVDVVISRSGYTGEDGFEISTPAEAASEIWRRLAAEPDVKPAGLGARDSLRLEAGLCLYGHDIDEASSPVEAALTWSIGQRRRREAGFAGDGRILAELRGALKRKRVGILPEGKAPAREGTEIRDEAGLSIGTVTSGGFSPSLGAPIAMGYVEARAAKVGTPVSLVVRGEPRPARIAKLPFVSHSYHKA
ncbi:MAG: glycine cleavage system aminomethyltransferase GcvT [Alphaproteobacteria bacterium]|nr:glycine cleavage system aminomethyltransferase GcvT [Alphaproteobacteria bacterium]